MVRFVMAMGVLSVMSLVRAAPPPGGERILRTEAVLDATPAQLWEAYTTKAGWESWAVPLAEVDFRLGGTFKTNYNKEAGIGGPGTITHHILAFEPGRMVATRFDAPEAPEWAKLAQACQVIVRLEPVSSTQTRFVETMVGWGEGAQWDESYAHFKQGNEWTMEQLRKRFPAPASDPEAAMKLLRSLVGGEWVHEGTGPDGKVFRVRNIVEAAPDGKSLVQRGWLGGEAGMFFHAAGQVWREGPQVCFQNLDQSGAIARGTIRATAENAVEWDWRQTDPDGSESRYLVAMGFEGNTYKMVLTLRADDGSTKEVVNIGFHRVAKAPAEFLRLRGVPSNSQPSESAATTIDSTLFPASGFVSNPLVKEVTVKASPDEVFKLWATPEGMKSFLVQDCKIDLRIGGPFELYFGGADVPQAERGSNGCQILSYVPGEMLSFTWNAPPKFPVERAQRAWVVVTFAPAAPGFTNVRLVHTGFGTGGQWPQVREYFEPAWTNVLAHLKKHYEP